MKIFPGHLNHWYFQYRRQQELHKHVWTAASPWWKAAQVLLLSKLKPIQESGWKILMCLEMRFVVSNIMTALTFIDCETWLTSYYVQWTAAWDEQCVLKLLHHFLSGWRGRCFCRLLLCTPPSSKENPKRERDISCLGRALKVTSDEGTLTGWAECYFCRETFKTNSN